MQFFRSPLLPAIAALLLACPAGAQMPKTYPQVAITLPAPSADPSLAKFRLALAAAAKRRIYAELEALVQPQGFFWDRDFANRYDPQRPAVDNLAVAIELERGDGLGWDRLEKLAEEKAVEPLDSRPGVICAPARPGYDALEFSRLLDTTYTTGADWAYPPADGTPVHTAPRPDAPVIGKLSLHFVRLMGFEGSASETSPAGNRWARVTLPDGRTGYVVRGSVFPLTVAQLCYIKDMVLGWRITGYIAGGN